MKLRELSYSLPPPPGLEVIDLVPKAFSQSVSTLSPDPFFQKDSTVYVVIPPTH